MKYSLLFLLFYFLFAPSILGQNFPNTGTHGSATTLMTNQGAYSARAYIPMSFLDTTQVNLNIYIKNYPGALVRTSSDGIYWKRSIDGKKWEQFGAGSGTVTSVGLSMPSAFTVTNSPVTGSGTLTVTGAGTTAQYIRGDGSLATFPTIPSTPTLQQVFDVESNNALMTTNNKVSLNGTRFTFDGDATGSLYLDELAEFYHAVDDGNMPQFVFREYPNGIGGALAEWSLTGSSPVNAREGGIYFQSDSKTDSTSQMTLHYGSVPNQSKNGQSATSIRIRPQGIRFFLRDNIAKNWQIVNPTITSDTAWKYLAYNPADSSVRVFSSNGISSRNIYNSDGTLSALRTVNFNSNKMLFTNVDSLGVDGHIKMAPDKDIVWYGPTPTRIRGDSSVLTAESGTLNLATNDASGSVVLNTPNGVGFVVEGGTGSAYAPQNLGAGVTPAYKFHVLDDLDDISTNYQSTLLTNLGSGFITTGGTLTNYVGYFHNQGTRQSGANDLVNVGLYSTASGGQQNYGAMLDQRLRLTNLGTNITSADTSTWKPLVQNTSTGDVRRSEYWYGGGGSGTVTGTGTSGQLALWSGTSSLNGSTDLTVPSTGIISAGIASGNGAFRSYQVAGGPYIAFQTTTGNAKSGIFRSNTDYFIYYNTSTGSTHMDATFAGSHLNFDINGTTKARLSTNGRLYVGGVSNATAVLELAAGTASANTAPFKYTSGVASQTTPENGAKNFDGSNEYITAGGVNYTLAKTLTSTATLNFDLTAVNSQDLTMTVTGAASGDVVSLALDPASVPADVTYFGWVSSANTVTIRCSRVGGGGAVDPSSGTFRASVIKY